MCMPHLSARAHTHIGIICGVQQFSSRPPDSIEEAFVTVDRQTQSACVWNRAVFFGITGHLKMAESFRFYKQEGHVVDCTDFTI